MKLLTKTNKYYLAFLILLAPVMIAVDYFVIQYIVNKEVNEILQYEGERILFYLQNEGELPASNYLLGTKPLSANYGPNSHFSDTLIFEAYTEKFIPYRLYKSTVTDGPTGALEISLQHVLLEMKALIWWLFATTALILLLLAIGLFFISQTISKWAWRPFYNNLQKLENYNLNMKNPVQLEASGISEFEALNKVIVALMNQIEKDFQTLKEFNENISHEMQTPLAIIRNKMVLLLESQSLGEKDLHCVQAAYQEVNKLSKIGKSLTLISRIENQEFSRLEMVDIRTTIDNIINNMEEIINFKKLKIGTHLEPASLNCDPILANILFTNLIKNAIQHNQEGGYIQMVLKQAFFEIENTGEVLKSETAPLFNRFKKGNTAADSPGLGLAINQKICERYGFRIEYHHHQGKHKITLLF